MSLASEIAEQPSVAARLLGPGREAIEAIADGIAPRLRDRDIDLVLVRENLRTDVDAFLAKRTPNWKGR